MVVLDLHISNLHVHVPVAALIYNLLASRILLLVLDLVLYGTVPINHRHHSCTLSTRRSEDLTMNRTGTSEAHTCW